MRENYGVKIEIKRKPCAGWQGLLYTTTSRMAGMTRQNIAHGYDSAPGSQPVDPDLGAMCGTACVDPLMESSSATLMFSTEESNNA